MIALKNIAVARYFEIGRFYVVPFFKKRHDAIVPWHNFQYAFLGDAIFVRFFKRGLITH